MSVNVKNGISISCIILKSNYKWTILSRLISKIEHIAFLMIRLMLKTLIQSYEDICI